MTRFQLIIEMLAGFGNDLDASFDEPLSSPIGFEIVERGLSHAFVNALYGFEDVL